MFNQNNLKEWKTLLDLFADPIMIVDDQHRIVMLNKATADAFNVDPEDTIGEPCFKLVHGLEEPPDFCPQTKTLKDGNPHRAEIYEERLKGHLIVSTSPLRDSNGRLTGSLHITQDINRLNIAEKALSESNEKYRAIFEQAADSIVIIDTNTGGFIDFNEKAHKNLGYTAEEFKKLAISDFEVMETADDVNKHIKKIIETGEDRFETQHRTKTGEIRDISVNSRLITTNNSDFIQSVWRDITGQKRVEDALKENEKKFRFLAENMADIVWTTDLEFKTTLLF